MTTYNRYTLDGEKFVVDADALYRLTDERHDREAIEESRRYLHDGRIVVFDLSFDIVTATLVHGDGDYYPGDDLTAIPVKRVIPDGIEACPGCGGWLGPKDNENNMCFECGYGRDEENSSET